MDFLFEQYDNASKNGFINFEESIPSYISQNLAHNLRDYQKQGLGRYLY